MTWNLIIRTLRQARGVTQSELAELLRVSESTIHKWETGRSSPSGRNQQAILALLEGFHGSEAHLEIPSFYWGGLLRTLRQFGSASQADLAQDLSVSPRTVSRWEGRHEAPRIGHRKKILELWENSLRARIPHQFGFSCLHQSVVVDFSSPRIAEVVATRRLLALKHATGFLWEPSNDGTLRDIRVEPGHVLKETQSTSILQVFDRPVTPRQTILARLSFTAHDVFSRPEEWYGFAIRYPTNSFAVRLCPPPERPFLQWSAMSLVGGQKTEFPERSVTVEDADGRRCLVWEFLDPELYGLYTLSWRW
jgi:DNA-binding transcriptional regulator YiaG